MRIKSIIAVLLAANLIWGIEPIIAEASDITDTVLNEEVSEEEQSEEELEEQISIEGDEEVSNEEAPSEEAPSEEEAAAGEPEEDENDIGYGLTFSISGSTLTISGSGEMRDWMNGYYADVRAPWANKDIVNVIIEDGVSTIGDSAFEDCSSIKSIVCKGDISKIGIGAFIGCTSLESLEFDGTVEFKKFTHIEDCTELNTLIFKKAASFKDEAIEELPKLKKVTFPAGCTFGEKSFYGCGLTDVTFMGSVDLSAGNCFAYCPELRSITFNGTGSKNKISDNAFYYCSNIASITFKDAAEIGETVFVNLPELNTITFPAGSTFGAAAFGGCSNVSSITFNGNADLSAGYCFAGCSKLKKLIFNGRGPEKSIISNNAFSGAVDIETINFKGPVDIGENEFMMAQAIKSLTFEGDTNIGVAGFAACEKLTRVTFNGDAELDPVSFNQCINLSKITFKKSAKLDTDYDEGIKYSPFHDCIKLKSIIFGGKASLGDGSFYGCNALSDVRFKDAAELGKGVLDNCPKLRKISFGGRLAPLDNRADVTEFCCDLPSLTTVVFAGDTDLPYGSFGNCNNSKLNKLAFKKSVILNTYPSEGKYAFLDSNIKTITFGDTTVLKYGAFRNNSSIRNVTFKSNASLGDKTFSSCETLRNVSFKGKSGKSCRLGTDALRDCQKLKKIYFGSATLSVSDGACSELPALTSVTFGGDTTLLGGCFAQCDNAKLTKLIFKKNASFRPSVTKSPFDGSKVSRLSVAGDADLMKNTFNDSNLKSVRLGASGKIVNITESLLRCGSLRTVGLTGTIAVTDSMNICPELTTVTIKYNVGRGESCSFAGEYFKMGCPKKIIVNGKLVQYTDL